MNYRYMNYRYMNYDFSFSNSEDGQEEEKIEQNILTDSEKQSMTFKQVKQEIPTAFLKEIAEKEVNHFLNPIFKNPQTSADQRQQVPGTVNEIPSPSKNTKSAPILNSPQNLPQALIIINNLETQISELIEKIKFLEERHETAIKQSAMQIENSENELKDMKGTVGSLLEKLKESEAKEQAMKKVEEFVKEVTATVMLIGQESEQRESIQKSIVLIQQKFGCEIKGQAEKEEEEKKEAAQKTKIMFYIEEEKNLSEQLWKQQNSQQLLQQQNQPLPKSSISKKILQQQKDCQICGGQVLSPLLSINLIPSWRENTLIQQFEYEKLQIPQIQRDFYTQKIISSYFPDWQQKHEIFSPPISTTELLKEDFNNSTTIYESYCEQFNKKQIKSISKQRNDRFGFLRSFGISYFLTKSALLNRTKSPRFQEFLESLINLEFFELKDLEIAFPSLGPLYSFFFTQFLQNYFTEKAEQWLRSSDPVAEIVQSLSDPVMDQSLQFMIRKLLIHAVNELTKRAQRGTLADKIDTKQVINKLISMEGPIVNDWIFIIASTFLKCSMMIFISQKYNVLLPKEFTPYQKMDPSIFDLSSKDYGEQSIFLWNRFDGSYYILYSPQQDTLLLSSENSVFKRKVQNYCQQS